MDHDRCGSSSESKGVLPLKRIIYYCYGGAHSSVMAAAIHLGQLPMDRVPALGELRKIGDLDHTQSEMIGMLHFQGVDTEGNEVYTLGVGAEPDLVITSVQSMIVAIGGDLKNYLFRSSLPYINLQAKIGGALSRRYGWVGLGRKVCFRGILSSYDQLIAFVKQTRTKAGNG
jgi:hypothetical protein